jgi:hypothetical protein
MQAVHKTGATAQADEVRGKRKHTAASDAQRYTYHLAQMHSPGYTEPMILSHTCRGDEAGQAQGTGRQTKQPAGQCCQTSYTDGHNMNRDDKRGRDRGSAQAR